MAKKAQQAQQPAVRVNVLSDAIRQSINDLFGAFDGFSAARENAQQVAKKTAEVWWNEWQTKPGNGPALDAAVASVKKGAEADGLFEGRSKEAIHSAFSPVSNYLYLIMSPSVRIPSPNKKEDGVMIDVQAAGTNARKVTLLAAEARRINGTGRNKAPTTPTAPPVQSAQAMVDSQIKTFEADQSNVLKLIQHVLTLDSGLGLIGEALKVYGWLLVPTAEKKAEMDAQQKALEFKRKSAEMAEKAATALKARTARRSTKK